MPLLLAGAFSIPHFLANGTPFPQRDFIIFLASSVMLISLLTANFALPFIAKRNKPLDQANKNIMERKLQLEVMDAAIKKLKYETTEENELAVISVIDDYKRMMRHLRQNDSKLLNISQREEIKVRIQALNIERNYIRARMEIGTITKEQANIYYRMLDNLERTLTTQTSFVKWLVLICKQLLQQFKMLLSAKQRSEFTYISDKPEVQSLKIQCAQAVVRELSTHCERKSDEATETVLDYYKTLLEKLRKLALDIQRKDENYVQHRRELHWIAVQAEREAVQTLYEKGD